MLRDAYWLKSMPCTSCAPSGTGSDGFKTASVAPVGAEELLAMAVGNLGWAVAAAALSRCSGASSGCSAYSGRLQLSYCAICESVRRQILRKKKPPHLGTRGLELRHGSLIPARVRLVLGSIQLRRLPVLLSSTCGRATVSHHRTILQPVLQACIVSSICRAAVSVRVGEGARAGIVTKSPSGARAGI